MVAFTRRRRNAQHATLLPLAKKSARAAEEGAARYQEAGLVAMSRPIIYAPTEAFCCRAIAGHQHAHRNSECAMTRALIDDASACRGSAS